MKRTAVAFAGLAVVLFFAPINTAFACGSDSSCRVGKCKSGSCGHCGSDSDCKGHSKCHSGMCNSCGSDSNCAVGKCKSGQCGACGSDSDCKGGKCKSGQCSNRDDYTRG